MTDALDRLALALNRLAPALGAARVAVWAEALTPPMRSSGIVTPNRAAAALGQFDYESDGFSALTENLNYTHADRIFAVFPSHFTDINDAAAYAGNPEALANRVYASRMGNGDEASGDGWRFRGGGLIQITGRDNYARLAGDLGMELNDVAAWVRMPAGAAASACWFWSRHALNQDADRWDIRAVTRAINGGYTGYSDRLQRCTSALAVLDA